MTAERIDRPRKPGDFGYLLFTGFSMGAADVVPGVSGGTMALIMGVYEELVFAIKSVDIEFFRSILRLDWKAAAMRISLPFLLSLGLGIVTAFVALAGLITFLMKHHTVVLFAFFFGLILASIVAIGVHIRWHFQTLLALVAGSALAYWTVGLVPLEMSHDPLTLFWSGAIAIMAMILPGISGSFILLILGQYEHMLSLVKSLDIIGLLPLLAGMVVGITSFSRVLSYLLKRWHQTTITLLTGFMIGSLRRIWPFKHTLIIERHGEMVSVEENIWPQLNAEFATAAVLCLIGFGLVLLLNQLKRGAASFAATADVASHHPEA